MRVKQMWFKKRRFIVQEKAESHVGCLRAVTNGLA